MSDTVKLNADNLHLLEAYRSALSSLMALEREMVKRGIMAPEDRRVLSRSERRALLLPTESAPGTPLTSE